MKYAYRITREDSGEAPDKTITASDKKEVEDIAEIFMEECLERILSRGEQKAVITIERVVVDE